MFCSRFRAAWRSPPPQQRRPSAPRSPGVAPARPLRAHAADAGSVRPDQRRSEIESGLRAASRTTAGALSPLRAIRAGMESRLPPPRRERS